MSLEEITAKALCLPPEQRALLAEVLWKSLEEPFKTPAGLDDAADLGLALERDCELEKGLIEPLSHQEIMRRLHR